jgi:hypothetical protein
LTAKEINFTASSGSFDGNSLFIDSSFNGKKITVKAILKQNPLIHREVTIYIKTTIHDEKLKTTDELLKEWEKKAKEKKVKKKNDG